MSEKSEMIPIDEAKRQIALACRRLGLLRLAFAQVLVVQLGEEKGKKMVARAIKEYSGMIGEKKREMALSKGLGLTPEDFSQVSDIPSIGMHERSEKVEIEGEKRWRLYGCVISIIAYSRANC